MTATRAAQWVLVGLFLVVFAAGVVVINQRSAVLPSVLAMARAEAPGVFESLPRMPSAEPVTAVASREYPGKRSGIRIEYQRTFRAEGRFDDAVAWARGQLLSAGWRVEEETSVGMTFRRRDSEPGSLWDAGTVKARWFFEIERDKEIPGARPSFTYVVRLRCYI